MADSNAAVVRNSTNVVDDEGDAVVAVTPGMLVERDADGGIRPHSDADGPAAPEFAALPMDPGKGLEDDYAVGERTKTVHGRPGVEINALLAGGNTVDSTTFLVSAGDGTLQPFTPQADLAAGEQVNIGSIVARAVESLTTAAGTPGRLAVVVV